MLNVDIGGPGYCYVKIGAMLDVKCIYWWSIGVCYAKIGALLDV